MKPDEDTSSSGSGYSSSSSKEHGEYALTQKFPTDHDFMTFLGLQRPFHNEFKIRLLDYVTRNKHSWARLLANEDERQTCATGFVDEVGMGYWGAEVNRKKYLLQESLADAGLFTYPERREEIIQVIMILLLKKAKSKKEVSQQGPEASSKRARESTPRKESKRSRARSSSRKPTNNRDCLSPELGDEPQPGADKESFNASKPILFGLLKNGTSSNTSSASATRRKPTSTTPANIIKKEFRVPLDHRQVLPPLHRLKTSPAARTSTFSNKSTPESRGSSSQLQPKEMSHQYPAPSTDIHPSPGSSTSW
ncbi:hypothetical protein VTN00DRAFT_7890 [Thermoascus crustaceus]|uniref:uncharacterized protein n=1 Tax=Thermoascus crustaceus TaxID=5088 RepID=UPI0037445B2F